jgi:hypothetical protein
MPDTNNLKWVRRIRFRVFEVRLAGTAIKITPDSIVAQIGEIFIPLTDAAMPVIGPNVDRVNSTRTHRL